MGVTIHFEGKLRSEDSFNKVIDAAKQFALSNGLTFSIFEEQDKPLQRVKDEKDWDYQGPTKGIVIQPDLNSDPLNLEFDKDLFVQEYCKTQFADITVHILAIDILRQIAPSFENLKVEDEGQYWETSDINILQKHIDNCFIAIDEAKQENAHLQGPFRLANGRIVDLMKDE
jgi:hypothetical protein